VTREDAIDQLAEKDLAKTKLEDLKQIVYEVYYDAYDDLSDSELNEELARKDIPLINE